MDPTRAFISLGMALGLGLLVGFQRERSDSALAGVRTFPLITMLGTLCAMLADLGASSASAAGLLAVVAATAVGNWLRPRPPTSPGITTEIAIVLMYVVGALLWALPDAREVPAAVAGACAILLHLREPLHGLVARFKESEVRGIMQVVLIWLVILPLVPDRDLGPWGVINPRQVWWVVVLVAGISLAAFIGYRLMPPRAGRVVAGILGGAISSTGTTVLMARQARASPVAARAAALVIAWAWAALGVRVVVEVAVVAPERLGALIGPLGIMLGAGVAGAAVLTLGKHEGAGKLPEPKNPTQLGAALVFALVYAVVVVLIEASQRWLGSPGVYGLAALVGTSDMDAVTLSAARRSDSDTAWRAIVIAMLSNTAVKAGLAGVLGGWALLARLLLPAALIAGSGLGLLLLWPRG